MAVRVGSPGGGRSSSTDSAQSFRSAVDPSRRNGRGRASSNGSRRFAGRMFVAAAEQLVDGTPVVRVMGEVDLATVPALEEALLGVERQPHGA